MKRDSTTDFNKVPRSCIANHIWEQIVDPQGDPTNHGKCKVEGSTCSTNTPSTECLVPDDWCTTVPATAPGSGNDLGYIHHDPNLLLPP